MSAERILPESVRKTIVDVDVLFVNTFAWILGRRYMNSDNRITRVPKYIPPSINPGPHIAPFFDTVRISGPKKLLRWVMWTKSKITYYFWRC